MNENKYIIIEGNVVDGLSFHGPFDSAEEAIDWAGSANPLTEWTAAPLQSVEVAA